MPTPAFQTPREKKLARRKVTTDLGKQIMTREKQRLAREQAALGEQLADEARRKLSTQQTIKRQAQPEQAAVQRSIVKRVAAVLQTEGVNVKITARCTDSMSAWTDFDQIVVNYRMQDDVRMLSATIRALMYHEGGHCRFTIPYRQLVELATGQTYNGAAFAQYHTAWNMLEDQRMETAVVSDSPRKAAYLTPMIMTEMTDKVGTAAANWPLLIWRRYLPTKIVQGARKLFVLKHNLMGVDGEALAKAWEQVTTDYVLADNAPDMWTAIVTAHELLKTTNTIPGLAAIDNHNQQTYAEQENLDDALVIPVSPDMLGEGGPQDPNATPPVIDPTDPEVAEHLATILIALFAHPETIVWVVYAIMQDSDETAPGSGSSSQPSDQDGDEGDDSDDDEDDASDADDSDAAGSGTEADADEGDEGENEEQGEDDGEGNEPEYANDGPRESGIDPERQGGSSGTHDEDAEVDADLDYKPEDDDDELDDDDLEEALAEAEAERDADNALDADVQAFQEAIENRVSDLTPYQTHASNDLEAAAAAHNLATELEQSFYASTMDSAPQWMEQQRRGVLNVIRYVTHQPGDIEFFRAWQEDDAPGFNLAVSVLLDYSGSMSGYTEELAQAGYATKLACEKLGVPCTVTLWDTGAQVLWDANETAEYLPVVQANGGTDPSVALADLVNQRHEKAQHVVLIMTDGEWQDNTGKSGYLAAYKESGRIVIGCGFNSGNGSSDHLAEKLRRYGCDESYAIKSLMEIPALLEQTLVALA
jgi:hypothetical protein